MRFAPPRHAGGWGLRRWAVAALVVLSFSTVLVVAPAPQWVSAHEAEVHTHHVRLSPRASDRAGDALALTGTSAAEARELRDALDAGPRRTTSVQRADVLTLGITVPEPPDGPVLVRGRVDGTWTPWFEVPFEPGEAPDADVVSEVVLQSEPVWLGDADAWEIDGPADLREIDVHAVSETTTRRAVQLRSGSAGASAPTIRSRASWGARPPTKTPATTADLKLAIVHHTVTGNTYTSAEVPAVLRSIQAYHQDARGYSDIAYNILVDRFGQAWEGRAGGLSNVVLGGHSQGFNTGSVGVAVIGDYRTASVSSAVFETVARVIAWKLAIHRVDPRSTVPYTSAGSAKYASGVTVTLPRVVGHRDVQSTDCPGGNLYARIGALRTRVAELVPAYQQGLLPELLGPDITGDGLTDPFEYRTGGGSDVQWRATSAGQFSKTSSAVNGAFRPAVGDFDGDGRDDLLWHGTGSARDYLWWSGGSGHTSQEISVGGSFVPVVGDFDGNGADDIFWYATGLAQDYVWYSAGRQHRSVAVREDLSTGVPIVGDFNGGGLDDVFFYGPGSEADDHLWWSRGQAWRRAEPAVGGWYIPAAQDANGDGRVDITWFAPGASTSYRWTFNSAGDQTSRSMTHAAQSGRPHVGDFDGDGREDLLLVASGAAGDVVWYSTATGIVSKDVTFGGTFAIAPGPMDGPPLLGPSGDDVLFVSNGSDWFWQGQPDRTFRYTQVG